MRTKEKDRDRMRLIRFIKELHKRQRLRQTCAFCNKILETMHHKDEDHTNNRPSNLLNVCAEHHLEIPHDSDSEAYIMSEAALRKSPLTWQPHRKPFKHPKRTVPPKKVARYTSEVEQFSKWQENHRLPREFRIEITVPKLNHTIRYWGTTHGLDLIINILKGQVAEEDIFIKNRGIFDD